MKLKKYLCVDAKDIQLIDYVFTDNVLFNSKEVYALPKRMTIGGGSSIQVFEKNDVPLQYQKMFISCNAISMNLKKMEDSKHRSNLRIDRFHRFKAKEVLTDVPLYLALSSSDKIFGQMAGDTPTFDILNCYPCESKEVYQFFVSLRENDLMMNYLKSLEEIMHIHIKVYDHANKKVK